MATPPPPPTASPLSLLTCLLYTSHNRGCFGACNFCSLAFHQGRTISCRSHESVIREVTALTHHPGFKGYIHDVGGPSATFRRPSCQKQLKYGMCKNRACLAPEPCPNLDADHTDYMMLLRKLRAIPGVKKVFIRSGIRFDYLMKDPSGEFFTDLVQYHISGQLKVAPEHCVNHTLDYMGKPHIEVYEKFREKYFKLNRRSVSYTHLVAQAPLGKIRFRPARGFYIKVVMKLEGRA